MKSPELPYGEVGKSRYSTTANRLCGDLANVSERIDFACDFTEFICPDMLPVESIRKTMSEAFCVGRMYVTVTLSFLILIGFEVNEGVFAPLSFAPLS